MKWVLLKSAHQSTHWVLFDVRANCLATNTEYCDRHTHATTQATNVAQIKTKGTKGLLIISGGQVRVRWKYQGLQMSCRTCD
jgi:hypothetical protein